MLKKILLAVLFFMPTAFISAQEIKLGYVNATEIMMVMPEIADYEKQMADYNEQNKKFLEDMDKEINDKYLKLEQERATLNQSIISAREQEIAEMQRRLQTAYQTFMSDGEKKQQELLKPIQEKLLAAIEAVGKKNNFLYIFTQETILFKSDKAINVAPLVKKELGLN